MRFVNELTVLYQSELFGLENCTLRLCKLFMLEGIRELFILLCTFLENLNFGIRKYKKHITL